MKTMTLEEYHAAFKAQGAKKGIEACVVCPMCGTIQNGNDLIAAGAGKTFEEVEKYIGFSCVGRWTHKKPPPPKTEKGKQVGCNWTLGGLFRLHEMEVVTEDGMRHPSFMPATEEEAKAHLGGQGNG